MRTDQILSRVKCCACEGPLDAVNLVSLDFKPDWDYPRMENVLSNDDDCAIAVICESCRKSRTPPKFALEFPSHDRDDVPVIYHPIGSGTSDA